MIHVQHLLGVGHLQRAAMLARAMADVDFDLLLVSGGRPYPVTPTANVELVQLAPLSSADSSFSRLIDEHDRPIDDAWRRARSNRLNQLYTEFAPQVLITESFPFARRMLRFELIPLLQQARADRHCRLVLASVRDVIQPKSRPERNQEICAWVEQYYDRVLVHGDPQLLRLENSFAESQRIASKIAYSGYIANPEGIDNKNSVGDGAVIVSAGGSNTGLALLRAAIAAKPLSNLADKPWRIMVSAAIGNSDFEQLRQLADSGTRVERNRPDFAALLKRARLSISQAGYNTVTDILRAGCRAVLVPFAESDEVEQSIRAEHLARIPGIAVLDAKKLSPQALAIEIDAADRAVPRYAFDLDGAAQSARLIRDWLAGVTI